jgi:hypothetical protein
MHRFSMEATTKLQKAGRAFLLRLVVEYGPGRDFLLRVIGRGR